MKKSFNVIYILFLAVFFNASCGHDKSETTTENSQMNQTTETVTAAGDNKSDDSDVKLVSLEIKCEGMTCTGCEGTVEKSVMTLNGVKNVKADHVNKIVKVDYVEGELTADEIESSITKAGYVVVKN